MGSVWEGKESMCAHSQDDRNSTITMWHNCSSEYSGWRLSVNEVGLHAQLACQASLLIPVVNIH